MVRVSASNESSGNPNNSGVDVQKDDATRYQWMWHDYDGLGSSLDSSDPELDSETVQSLCPSPSEVWGCYDTTSPRPQTSSSSSPAAGNSNEASVDESLDSSSDICNDGELSPEKEFLSYAKKLPRPQFSGIDLLDADNRYCYEVDEVYVLLFGVGETSTEGIYSLRSYCSESGLHKETIICFESFEDAARFSGLLEATMPHLSTVHTIKPSELIQFCNDSGYACRLELEGSILTPPEFNVGVTDWERSMKLRQGHYEVLDTEPELGIGNGGGGGGGGNGNSTTSPSMKQETIQETKTESTAADTSRISDSINMQIEDVREMLERLLPDD
eukprot:g6506.t1